MPELLGEKTVVLHAKNREKVYLEGKMHSKFVHNEIDTYNWQSYPAANQK